MNCSARCGCRQPGVAGGELGEHGERALALLVCCGDVGAHPQVALGALFDLSSYVEARACAP
jgi:hypothetical protein